MSKSKNVHWTEKYARAVLEAGDRRKLSNSALARELGVSPQRINWWRKRLRAAQTPTQPAFVEVKLAASSPHPFAIRTNKGRTIEVWPGFDAAELARLIAAVEK